ncbi:MAG TPA: glycosyltransferase [Candidatus Dormibacteraeota bacterium]|jgi:glycosyltransferase involved in cell wall biosynthesis|nr:glycosyltransferase [Candidatus Dormibacteraeota bacterium]
MRPLIGAVVPALDEEEAIGVVVLGLRESGLVDEVVVVDNGSRDDTAGVAARAGARVVPEPRRGYGRACLAGVRASRAQIVLLLDGDAADDLGDLPHLLAPILDGKADLVVGSRTLGHPEPGSLTLPQIVGNRVIAFFAGAACGARVTDLGPMRAIRRQRLLALGMREMTYGWSVEMLLKALRAGYRYCEVPVAYRRRLGGSSKVGGTLIGGTRAGFRIIATSLRYAGWRPANEWSRQP